MTTSKVDRHSLEVLEFEKVRRMILRWTFSPLGRELAASLRPDLEPEQIRISQERISEWKRLELRGEAPGAEDFPDLRPTLLRLQRGIELLDGTELHPFLGFISHLASLWRLREELGRSAQPAPRLLAILAPVPDCGRLLQRLRRSIGPSGEVLDTASPELAAARAELLASQQRASQLLDDLRGNLPDRREEAFVTLREGRYVLSVRAGQRAAVGGLLHGRSSSGQSVLLEPFEAVEANNHVAETSEEERREVARVLRELTGELRRHAVGLSAGFEAAGLCDLVRAQARTAMELRAEPPEWNSEGRLRLRQGRHPILAEAESRGGPRVVPLDLEMDRGAPVLVISGPNMGGKSVALKTVGLLTLMTRAGLHVPAADGTEIPLADEVFVDLGDEQSIEGDLSTFAGHLRNIGRLWEKATRDSLVLLDEIGGGTDPEDGAAMAMAVLQEMSERGVLTLASTHLSAVKHFVGEQQRMQNAAMDFDAQTLTPRFRLKVGEAGWSRAFDIARRIVPDPDFLRKAERFRSPVQLRLDSLLGEVDREKQALVQRQELLERERERLEEATVKKDRQAARLRERIGKIRADRDEALGSLYRETEEWARSLRESIEAKAKEKPPAAATELRRVEREVAQRTFELRERKRRAHRGRPLSAERLETGAEAWLADLGAVVRIVRVADGKAWVEWQGRRLEVAVSALEEIPEGRSPRPQPAPVITPEVQGPAMSRELDLRGFRVEEAIEELDRFLDRASVQRLHQVRIVHGKGTGALKREVEKHLKTHPLVTGFRMGELNEGGWGVTVADLAGD